MRTKNMPDECGFFFFFFLMNVVLYLFIVKRKCSYLPGLYLSTQVKSLVRPMQPSFPPRILRKRIYTSPDCEVCKMVDYGTKDNNSIN